jgi:cholesterol transport system auxiliary component
MRRLWLTVALSSCALLSKGEVGERRFYSPESTTPSARAAVAPANVELRLGRVTAGACGSERMMFRQSPFEVGFSDERRWTEKPEVYLRRALSRVLFEEQGLRSVVRGPAPVLDVELLEFEEVLAPAHVGRVKVSWALSDERVVSAQQTLTFERPVAASKSDGEGEAVAQALSGALADAVDALAATVRTALTTAPTRAAAAGE